MASAPLFKWAAADDVLGPTFVGSCVAELDDAGDAAVLSFPRTTLIDERSVVMSDLYDDDLDLRNEDPVRRFDQVLQHRVEWHPVFGVIRTQRLRRTPGIAAFPYADISLLAELSLLGRFHQVPERTFFRRYHERRSIVAGPSFVQQVAWYDPRRRVRYAMPMTRLSKELMGVVSRADLSAPQKLRARSVVLQRWAFPHWRQIGGEAKLAMRAIASPHQFKSRIPT